jgi:hypothetical protein
MSAGRRTVAVLLAAVVASIGGYAVSQASLPSSSAQRPGMMGRPPGGGQGGPGGGGVPPSGAPAGAP